VAEQALKRIAELYTVEAQARDGSEEARLALRQQEALPRLNRDFPLEPFQGG